MKRHTVRTLAALATAGLLLSAAPAHADDLASPSHREIIVKPDPWERFPTPRPPRLPCPVKPVPPDWQVPLYCERFPIQLPVPEPVDPIIPGPIIPGPVVPIETHGE